MLISELTKDVLTDDIIDRVLFKGVFNRYNSQIM